MPCRSGLVSELSDILTRVASEPGVRVVVLTGAGPTFCSGMDLKEAVAAHPDAEDEKKAVAYAQALADLIWQVHQIPQADDRRAERRCAGGGGGAGLGLRLRDRGGGGPHRLSRGPSRAGRGDRDARPDPPGGRPPRPRPPAERTADRRRRGASGGAWSTASSPPRRLPGRGAGPGPLARRVGPPAPSRRPSGCSTRRAAGPPTLAARPPSPRPSASRTRPARGSAPSSRNAPRAGPRRPGAARRRPSDRAGLDAEGRDSGAPGPTPVGPAVVARSAQFHTEDAMVRHDDEQTPWVADQTVGDALRITASRFPDRDALVFPALGLRWSWGEFDRRVDLAASGLIARGVEPRRARRHLVDERPGVGRHPVRRRPGRRGAGQHQPGLPAPRAGGDAGGRPTWRP